MKMSASGVRSKAFHGAAGRTFASLGPKSACFREIRLMLDANADGGLDGAVFL